MLGLFLVTCGLAQNQAPLPRGAPEALAVPGVRVHVRAHEDLHPDRLRELARPGVTLWLDTSSNTLRDSTVENVARFDLAWVRLRPPLKLVDRDVFRKLPRAGAWVDAQGLELGRRLPGARLTAVELRGPLDEPTLRAVEHARPAEVRWVPGPELELLAWGQFAQLPGRRILVAGAGQLQPVDCKTRKAGDPSLELHVASLLALSSDVFPCGPGTRVILQPGVEPWLVQSLLTRDPAAELVVEVGASAERALGARALLDHLQLGPGR